MKRNIQEKGKREKKQSSTAGREEKKYNERNEPIA